METLWIGVRSLRTPDLVIVGMNLALPLTWLLSLLKGQIGIPITLFGALLWLSGLALGLRLARSGEASLTGRTSNLQGDSQSRQMMNAGQSSQPVDWRQSGKQRLM